MTLKTYSIFLFSFFVSYSNAQINTDLRPVVKSPEVNKFEQYLNMPVNLVSGTPQINIPIYTLEYGGMSLPISLEYDASGVKVESIASSVGLNWSLNVGGTVSRIVKGAPDEGSPYVVNNYSNIATNGYYRDFGFQSLNNALNAQLDIPNRYTLFNNWLNDVFQSYLDAQPDLFYFSTPEGGSKFVFNDHRDVVYLENTDFLVKENFSGSEFTSWNITSPKGIKYTFGVNNTNEQSVTSNIGELLYQYKTGAWFLNEISNNSTNDKITIEYIDNNYSTVMNKTPSKLSPPCLPRVQTGSQCGSESFLYDVFAENPFTNDTNNPTIFSGGNSGPNLENHLKSKLIGKIKAGKIEINFNYSVRNDVSGLGGNNTLITAQKLDEIQVLQNGLCVKKFKLNYMTTISNEVPLTVSNKRLILNSFVETSCDDSTSKRYSFNYDTQVLPSKLSYAQDKWGYYNGIIGNISLVPMYKYSQNSLIYGNRSVGATFALAGILQKITYPTGGSVNFEYESNLSNVPVDFKYDVANPIGSVVSISSPQSATGLYSSVFTYNANVSETLMLKTDLYYNPTSTNGCFSSTGRAASIVDNVTGATIAQINYQGLVTSKTIIYPIDKNLLIDQRQYTLIVQGMVEPVE